jgi:hypothetical protein
VGSGRPGVSWRGVRGEPPCGVLEATPDQTSRTCSSRPLRANVPFSSLPSFRPLGCTQNDFIFRKKRSLSLLPSRRQIRACWKKKKEVRQLEGPNRDEVKRAVPLACLRLYNIRIAQFMKRSANLLPNGRFHRGRAGCRMPPPAPNSTFRRILHVYHRPPAVYWQKRPFWTVTRVSETDQPRLDDVR